MAVRNGTKSRVKKSIPKLTLPEAPSEISNNLSDYIWLLYGERKIGKTTLLAQFEDVFFLMFDPKNRGLAIYQRHVSKWEEFLKYIKLLEENPDYCKMVIIDTGFMAYEMCYAYVCKKHGVEDPRDKGWAVVWKDISREFMEAHERILNLGLGLGITAHADIKEITRKDGTSYNKLTTQLGSAAFKYYNGLVDIIAYYHYNEKGNRELLLRGDSLVEAGTRIEQHFQYTDGSPVVNIPMGKNPKEAFNNVQKAFNNQLMRPKEAERKSKTKKSFKRKKR